MPWLTQIVPSGRVMLDVETRLHRPPGPLEHLGNHFLNHNLKSSQNTKCTMCCVLCAVCTIPWVRVLDTVEEKSEEGRFIPEEMHENHTEHFQQAAVEPKDNIIRYKTRVGWSRD